MSEQRQTKHKLSRSKALIAITQDYLLETGVNEFGFSKLLFTNYLDLVPEAHRTINIVPWYTLPPARADIILGRHSKRFERYLRSEVPIPMDLEEAWIETLPDGYRERAVVQLCGRYQVAAIELHHEMNCAGVGEFLKRSSAFMESIGRILDDGVIDVRDQVHLPEARQSCRRLVSACIGVVNHVEETLGIPRNESFLQALSRSAATTRH